MSNALSRFMRTTRAPFLVLALLLLHVAVVSAREDDDDDDGFWLPDDAPVVQHDEVVEQDPFPHLLRRRPPPPSIPPEDQLRDVNEPVEHLRCRTCTTLTYYFYKEALRPAQVRYGVYLNSRRNIAGGAVRERGSADEDHEKTMASSATRELPHYFRDRMVAELHDFVDGLCERIGRHHVNLEQQHTKDEEVQRRNVDREEQRERRRQLHISSRMLVIDREIGKLCGEVLEEMDEALSATAFGALMPPSRVNEDDDDDAHGPSSLKEAEVWAFNFCAQHSLCIFEVPSDVMGGVVARYAYMKHSVEPPATQPTESAHITTDASATTTMPGETTQAEEVMANGDEASTFDDDVVSIVLVCVGVLVVLISVVVWRVATLPPRPPPRRPPPPRSSFPRASLLPLPTTLDEAYATLPNCAAHEEELAMDHGLPPTTATINAAVNVEEEAVHGIDE